MSDFAVAVIIPAHDEAERVGRAIRSVARSLRFAGVDRSCVVVVADACTDGTADIARRQPGEVDQVLVIGDRCVGAARRAGAVLAVAELGGAPELTWMLSLDADSIAPTDWVQRHLRHAAAGVECVSGVVELDDDLPASLRVAFEQHYRPEAGSIGHTHVHGTNFGIRADTLLAVGNWPLLESGEDHALWSAVGAAGRPRAQDPELSVSTSGRLIGRAPRGFADDLVAIAATV